MGDTNYFSGVVKILENPIQTQNKKILITKLRAEIPQLRKTKIVCLIFLGNVANEIKTYYHINDYILIEGYIAIENQTSFNLTLQNQKQVFIIVLKSHPFFFN